MSEYLPAIVVVEDDADQAALLRRVLWRAQVVNPVHVATAAAEADELLATVENNRDDPLARPVLVLLDLHMRDWNGLSFLERLRRAVDARTVPVVVLSGSAQADDIDRAFELGANSYLVKPVAFEALADTLENLGLPKAILPSTALPDRPATE
ncbi:MAG: response regulator [Chloroflexota bacterium]|nr:response regulator [Chloroflexota bacterium]